MSSRPSGTVTFLFTDIEGSTRLWDDHGEAMRAGLEQHDQILRTAIEAAGGYVFTTAGDAFSAAFADPTTAVRTAVDGQLALAGADWGELGELKVRMALHTGVAHERDGDYFGPALNRAARILSAGHGGQILLSLGTKELIDGSSGAIDIHDLGEHMLKDLGRPEHIYQANHPDLDADFPRLRSLDAFPNNLPIQLTSFVGRETELNDVIKRLHDSRLLTLTGVGGSGKTRLSLQAAAESITDYPNGIWLVELASIGDPDLIAAAIGDVLGLTRNQGGSGNSQLTTGSSDILVQVTDHLSHRTSLLVLDNCEHLITATARLVQHLLQHCPDLTVLATSREGLGIPGEVLWQVPSLVAVSDSDPLDSDAVRLFVERAQDANPRFAADTETLRWVRQVCERLDGMPLAIELAAARSRVLDAKQIAERLDDRFRLLTGGSRTALPRHQTLEATVDWSYELMSETEKAVFQRLAAFRGGFTLAAAESVCADDSVDNYEVLDLIGHLVDKSMVTRDDMTGRFGMLETLRQYALRRLTESDEVDRVRVRHAEYFRDFAAVASDRLNGPDEAEAYDQLSADHDNFRAAIAYCLENGLGAEGATITAHLAWYWWAASDIVEGLRWIRKALPYVDEVESRIAIQLLASAALFAGFQLEEDAPALADQAMERATAADDAYGRGLTHMARGYIAWTKSEYEAAHNHMLLMLEAGEAAGDDWLIANANLLAGFSDRMLSRLDEAAARLAAAEVAYRRTGQPSGLGWVLSVSGQIARYRGDFDTEVTKQREARALFEEQGAPFQVAFTLMCESIALTLAGRPDEAVHLSRQAVAIERELTLNFQAIEALSLAGWVEHDAGNLSRARDLHEEAVAKLAPHFDKLRSELVAWHLSDFMTRFSRWDDAARLDGFHLDNLSRPEPEIYRNHFAPGKHAYRAALGEAGHALVEEGRRMTGQELHDYALRILDEVRPLVAEA